MSYNNKYRFIKNMVPHKEGAMLYYIKNNNLYLFRKHLMSTKVDIDEVIGAAVKSKADKIIDYLLVNYPNNVAIYATKNKNFNLLLESLNYGANNYYEILKESITYNDIFHYMISKYKFSRKQIIDIKYKILKYLNINLIELVLSKYNSKEVLLEYFDECHISNNEKVFIMLNNMTKDIKYVNSLNILLYNACRCGSQNTINAILKIYPLMKYNLDTYKEIDGDEYYYDGDNVYIYNYDY